MEFVTSDNPVVTFVKLQEDLWHPGHGFRTPEASAPPVIGMGPDIPDSLGQLSLIFCPNSAEVCKGAMDKTMTIAHFIEGF
jgi:hypothetical protein